MTAANQWSLFTVFMVVSVLAVIFAIIQWFGFETVILASHRIGLFVALGILAQFVLLMCARSIRQRRDRVATDIRIEDSDPSERRLPDVEFVIAAAEKGFVSEPHSSIRYLDLPVSDQDIAQLADCTQLKWLVLDNTDVSDAGLAFLHGLSKLRRLYLRGSRVTAEGVEQLKAALPDVTVLY